MRLLAFSTAEQGCSLAVTEKTVLLHEEFWHSRITHSKRLVGMVSHALEERVGIALNEIDGFVAAKGPGSFTGLRIGISVAQALAYAAGKPGYGISSLDGIAYRFSHSRHPVCVMMDARRGEVYTAVFKFDRGALISKTEETVIDPKSAMAAAGPEALFVGSGSKVYQHLIEERWPLPHISNPAMDTISAAALVRSLGENFNFVPHSGNNLIPTYIRKSDAELQFAEKQG